MKTSALLHAVQHIRRMRGGAQAHLIRASDNKLYVTKFQNNPQHIRILANEYLGTRLGVSLGIPMPEVRIIDVSEWLIEHSPEMHIGIAGVNTPCTPGLQFGSCYVGDPELDQIFDYLPETVFYKLRNKEDFFRVLAFDKWTCNSDGRQAVFVKHRTESGYRVIFIDQGYCFNAGEWTFPDQPLRGVYARNSVYERITGWGSFEPTLSLIEGIQRIAVEEIAEEIPPEWYEQDFAGLLRLTQTLIDRRAVVKGLINEFRRSSRSPFPRWLSS
jgi:hypothetical protein